MTNQSTIDKLIEMHMTPMADAFRIQMNDSSMREVYMPAGESTLHGVLVHGFRSCSALFPVC